MPGAISLAFFIIKTAGMKGNFFEGLKTRSYNSEEVGVQFYPNTSD
jgi:hypothetical protein